MVGEVRLIKLDVVSFAMIDHFMVVGAWAPSEKGAKIVRHSNVIVSPPNVLLIMTSEETGHFYMITICSVDYRLL